ncbi:hypothetical protein CMO93_01875 [Candidatus Woesearchaeota archaeon]|nr:hypothetical protein [Candidatus Woesearchaeota archaeon]|tara:strand:- start:758 stop:2326 length:1569 start_codon:yes stop_codon:yes gene_type:complete
MNKKQVVLLLSFILLFGTILRITAIASESFWMDEGLEAMVFMKYDAFEILKNVYLHGQILPGDYDGVSDLPLYHVSLEYWTLLWGISETSLRLYSALFGVLSIIFVFLIAKQLYGVKNALLSSFLFSISIPAIHFSQEARHYSLYLFLGVASIYYFIISLKSNKNIHWGLYIIFTILGLYTHYLFEILLIFQISYLIFYLLYVRGYPLRKIFSKLLRNKGSIIRKTLAVYLIIALIAFPLIPRTFRESNDEAWRTAPTLEGTARFFVNISTWIYPSEELRTKIKSMQFFDMSFFDILLILSVALTFILSYSLVTYLIYSKLRRYQFKKFIIGEKSTVFLAGWFVFPIILTFILSITTPIPIFGQIHYLLYCVPPFIILLSEAMLSFKLRHFKFLLTVFILIQILPLNAYYSNVDKQQWRELAEYMKGKLQDNEVLITSISSGAVTLRYYYGDAENIYGVRNLKETKEIINGKERIWLVLSFWKYGDPNGLIQEYINQNYDILESKSFFDIEIYHMQKKDILE